MKPVRTKTQEVKSIHVKLTMEIIAKHQSIILSADYMFVNSVPFFNTYSCDIRFITSRQNDSKTDITTQAIKSINAYYEKRGFKIVELREYQQFKPP